MSTSPSIVPDTSDTSKPIQIRISSHIEYSFGHVLCLELNLATTIGQIKHRIGEYFPSEKRPLIDEQLLIYQGHILNNASTVEEVLNSKVHSIDSVTFHLVVRWSNATVSSKGKEPQRIPETATTSTSTPILDSSARSTLRSGNTSSVETRPSGNLRYRTSSVVTNLTTRHVSSQPSNFLTSPLQTYFMHVPQPDGHVVDIVIPSQDIVFTTDSNGAPVASISPNVLYKLAATGIQIQLNQIFTQIPIPTPTVAPLVPTPRARLYDQFTQLFREPIHAVVARDRRAIAEFFRRNGRYFLVGLRVMLLVEIFGIELNNPMHFWGLLAIVVLAILWQSNILERWARPLRQHIPLHLLNLPHRLPAVPNTAHATDAPNIAGPAALQAAAELPQTQDLLAAQAPTQPIPPEVPPVTFTDTIVHAFVMFVSSIVPALHDRWAREDRRRREYVENLERRRREEVERQEREEIERQEREETKKREREQSEHTDEHDRSELDQHKQGSHNIVYDEINDVDQEHRQAEGSGEGYDEVTGLTNI